MPPASFRVAEQAGGAASAPAFSPGAHPARPAASAWPSINLGQATTPPTDLRAYGTSLARAIDRTHPVLAVIENERTRHGSFYTGSATDYLRQLRTAPPRTPTAPG